MQFPPSGRGYGANDDHVMLIVDIRALGEAADADRRTIGANQVGVVLARATDCDALAVRAFRCFAHRHGHHRRSSPGRSRPLPAVGAPCSRIGVVAGFAAKAVAHSAHDEREALHSVITEVFKHAAGDDVAGGQLGLLGLPLAVRGPSDDAAGEATVRAEVEFDAPFSAPLPEVERSLVYPALPDFGRGRTGAFGDHARFGGKPPFELLAFPFLSLILEVPEFRKLRHRGLFVRLPLLSRPGAVAPEAAVMFRGEPRMAGACAGVPSVVGVINENLDHALDNGNVDPHLLGCARGPSFPDTRQLGFTPSSQLRRGIRGLLMLHNPAR